MTTLNLDTATELREVLGRLSRRLRPTTAASLAGLTPTKVAILLAVVRGGRTRIADLAAAEGINPTMLSRAISNLLDAGLIERTSDDADRRAAWVQPTDAARTLAEQIRRERTEAVRSAMHQLGAGERAQLVAALPALGALAELLGEAQR